MPILGTAGHIDHGKTALIKALTGTDTDRLKEERERGISIDLGFAAFDIDTDVPAGVVDVPGHERFIRNMLAGAHGVDLVLLVVAADDGVMPQTEEHLDILHLLGARHGIVALTKVDLVDHSRRQAVREEIEILLDGTGLQGAPVHEVSAVTGEGVEGLRIAIRKQLRDLRQPESAGYFRMPVDRAFVMRGHGVVVTGTVTAGSVAAGAAVRVLPGGIEARVRGIQVHGRTVAAAYHGQRTALNLGNVQHHVVRRGQVICDPEFDRVTSRFDARVELRPAARRPLPTHSQVRVHVGTAEVMGKVIWLDGRTELAPNDATYAQLVLRQPVAAFSGDRFIVREQTARATIGGGLILHPFAPQPRRRADPRLPLLAALHEAPTPLARLKALLALESAFAVSADYLAAAANLRADAVRNHLARDPDVRPLPDAAHAEAYATAEKWERLRSAVEATLADFHRREPRRPGMEMESLRSKLAAALPPKVFRTLIAELENEKVLVRQDSCVRLPSHQVGLDAAEQRLAENVEQLLASRPLAPPDPKQIGSELGLEHRHVEHLLLQLEREGRVARVAPDLYFTSAAVEEARDLIRRQVAADGEIDAARFRDLIGSSRKFSIALLNYFDRTGFTLRVGDVRKLRAKGGG